MSLVYACNQLTHAAEACRAAELMAGTTRGAAAHACRRRAATSSRPIRPHQYVGTAEYLTRLLNLSQAPLQRLLVAALRRVRAKRRMSVWCGRGPAVHTASTGCGLLHDAQAGAGSVPRSPACRHARAGLPATPPTWLCVSVLMGSACSWPSTSARFCCSSASVSRRSGSGIWRRPVHVCARARCSSVSVEQGGVCVCVSSCAWVCVWRA
jgi:hypothetical protein